MNVDRHGGPWAVAVLCAIVALGVGLRVYAAAERADDPNDPVQDDSLRYFFIARSLYLDHSFDAPEVQRDDAYHPGSPLFHASIWTLTGGVNPKASRIAAALLSALMIVFTFLLARRLAWEGERERAPPVEATIAGLVAALLIAVYPSSIDYYRSLMNEPLASIVLVAAVVAFLWASEKRTAWAWAAPGALIGLLVMFRPEALVYGVALAAIALVRLARAGNRNGGLAAASALLAAMALALVPWTVRNTVSLHEVTPVSEGGGNALFIGTYLPGDGDHFKTYDRREQLMDEYGVPAAKRATLPRPPLLGDVLELVAAQAHPELSQDEALAKLGREQLKDDITDHPAEYAGVLAQKLWNMWGNAAAAKPEQAGPGLLGDWYHRLVVMLGLAGLVLLGLARRWEAWVLGAIIVLATAIAVITLSPPRRNVDLLPLVSALAAYLVVQVGQRRPLRRTTTNAPAKPNGGASA